MAKDMKSVALKAVQKKTGKVEENDNSSPQKSKLYKDYFSLDTGQPIALDKISKKVKRRFSDIDRNSALAMMDLWFMHAQWNYFYSRTDSFSKYVREELEISRNHAYSILSSVTLLQEFFIYKGNTDSEVGDFVQQITSSIDNIGMGNIFNSCYLCGNINHRVMENILDSYRFCGNINHKVMEKN